jgi:pimeloyl-ACP methyl ester carboxylesterase
VNKKLLFFAVIMFFALVGTSVSFAAEANEIKDLEKLYNPQRSFAKLNGGFKIAYVELGDKSNPPVVLIHGVTDSYLSFSQVAPRIADAGFYVIVPDLRGHGKTDKPNEGYYTLDDYTADINALLEKLGVKKAHITGHSLGSFIAQNLAIKNPDKVSSLTLIGSASKIKDNPTLAWLLEGDDEFPGINKVKKIPDSFLADWTASSNYDENFVKKTYENAKALPLYVWKNALNGISINSENIEKIKVPVEIIWGTKDDFFPIKDQVELIENLGSSRIVFIKKEGAGHNTHWENRLDEEVAKDIVDFIEK